MLPHKIRVGAVTYTVVTPDFIEINQNRNYAGACRRDKTLIEVLDSLSKERKKGVFVHELVHAILDEAGFIEHDEDLVERFANVLHGVLRDNDFGFLREEE